MLVFLAAALVIIVIPGPDQALITRNALVGGRVAGLLTMLGGSLGLTVHATAAAIGISAVLLASPTAFTVLKLVGVAYLVWMGVQTIRAAGQIAPAAGEGAVKPTGPELRHVRQGFLCNSLNPKVALFFVTFLPQFLPRTGDTFGHALALSASFAALYLVWFGLYVLVVDRFAAVLRRPIVLARLEQATGLLLVGFAVHLAVQHS